MCLQGNSSYQFGFDVKDDEYTNYQQRKEVRDGNVIKGSYSVVDSDGFIRTVTYTADPKEGFKADVVRQRMYLIAWYYINDEIWMNSFIRRKFFIQESTSLTKFLPFSSFSNRYCCENPHTSTGKFNWKTIAATATFPATTIAVSSTGATTTATTNSTTHPGWATIRININFRFKKKSTIQQQKSNNSHTTKTPMNVENKSRERSVISSSFQCKLFIKLCPLYV